ncbi:MAG: AMP-binding protein [Candidatus Vecturithrix sp.]|jgi:long-chain acyl-CoA synthetase|nr:AMP-binding protein [Candidatus Vecturithrix sp.]
MSGAIFLTGATGFLGSQIARQLLRDSDDTIVALVRAGNPALSEAEKIETAIRRLSRIWRDWPDLMSALGSRVEVLYGDVSAPDLGLQATAYDALVRRITHIIHAAADLRLNASLDEICRINVQGTASVLDLARAAHKDHGLIRLAHISTAYVAGARQGDVPEDALTAEFGFSNVYELSKYQSELLVQQAKQELPVSVFRPGMIVGDSRTGAIKTFNTLYFPFRLYLTGRLRVVPTKSELPMNLVPVDYVAEAVVRLTLNPNAEGLNFHLIAPQESLPTAGDLMEFIRQWAQQYLNLRLARPLFLPIPLPSAHLRRRLQQVVQRKKQGLLSTLISLWPYFNEHRRFQRDNVDRLLGCYTLKWRDFLPHLLEYAVYTGFMHRSDRTVHEQILFRLQSRSRPVMYHDIVDGNVVTRTAAEVRHDILAAAGALRTLGIRPGDRVALVGLNSTRYLTLDVAIGLVGAVSVPLYYTSPPQELDAILKASGARLLLVGAPKLLERVGEFARELPVISFCRGSLPEARARKVIPWEEFLELGSPSTVLPPIAPVSFGDIATLRYTSGTTGRPKGVIFKHDHLRWMAEAIAALPPWKARNRTIFYLSFLPMNHVVEGILATYSPYYLPAPLEIYFLENFQDLRQALPGVRPTVFFSVPRFYEKVWDNLLASKVVRWCVTSRKGFTKALLWRLLRRGILRKAGLDRCAQLIAGSAPASEDLLRSFQELGIEIHNAYGLTEAPLITINRLGANRIGTVGQPLPMTQVQIAADGEVLVRGPQVTTGYFDEEVEPPFKDGWLLTGDLGYVTDEGSLGLYGRKKELIITAYGKNIHPTKIEAMLRDIPGVSEAMLVGDGRPYCTALLWIENHTASAQTLAGAIETINRHLSHPEQVKRWAVLPNDLSIQNGDLTANLKLKRQVIAQKHADVIDALYKG